MIKTKSRIFNISSSNAINGSFKSNVNISLPDLTFHHNNIQNAYISVSHAEVANSFYVVNYTNNQIVIDNITYTLPVGNYNVNTFIAQLKLLIPVTFNITYNSVTTKLTFTNSTVNFTINASSSDSTINKVVGLGVIDETSTLLTLTLPYVVNFLPLQRINFRSNFLKLNNYNSRDNSSDVFLSLQNNSPQNSVIYYINQTNTKQIIEDLNITSFVITVTDDDNNLINFNNVDWFLTFQIDIDYLELPKLTNLEAIIKGGIIQPNNLQ
jgi:hypothetical protein